MKAGDKRAMDAANRSWGRRLALSLVFPPLVLVLFIIVAIIFVLGTPWGSHLALSCALDEYNRMIPGHIAVETISGTILFGPAFERVSLVDRNGDSIVTTSELHLEIDPFALARETLHVESLIVKGADVYLRSIDNKSSFGDLAPDDDGSPKEPEPEEDEDLPSAPRFPFDLVVDQLEISDATLYSVADDNPNDPRSPEATSRTVDTIVRAEKVALYCRWNGGDGAVRITDIKGEIPSSGLKISDADLGATLWDARFSRLNNGRIETNRGTVHLETAAYDIAAIEGDAQVEVTIHGDQLHDILPSLPKDQPISLQLRLAMLSDMVELAGLGHTGVSDLQFQGAVGLAPNLDGTLEFNLTRIQGAHFVSGLKADLNGRGQVQMQTTPKGEVNGSITFDGHSDTASPMGQVKIAINGVQEGGTLKAALRVRGDHGRAAIQATLKEYTDITANWKLRVKRLSPFAEAFSLPAASGMIASTGSCRGALDTPSCSVSLDAEKLSMSGVKLASLTGNSAVSFGKNRFSIRGRASLRELELAGQVVKETDLEVVDTDTGFDLAVAAVGQGDNRATLLMHVITGPPTLVRISRLQSRIGEIPVELEEPLEIRFSKKAVSIAGGELLVGPGRVVLRGDLSRRGKQNLKLEIQNMELALFSPFTGGVELDGLVDGNMVVSGPATRPKLELDLRSSRIKVNTKSLLDVKITGVLKDNRAHVTTSVLDEGIPLANFHLSAPIRFNLAASQFVWMKEKPQKVRWNVTGLQSHHIADWIPNDTMEFDLNGNGELTFSAHTAEGHAEFNGSLGYADSERTPFSAIAQVSSTVQKITLTSPGLDANPVSVEMDLALSIPKLLDNSFDMGPSRLVATMGKTTMRATSTYHGESHFDVDMQFSEIDLSQLNPYLENPALSLGGIGGGSGRISISQGNMSTLFEIFVEGLSISDHAIGNLAVDTRWQSNRLAVRVDLQDKTRTRIEATAIVPLLNDPKPDENRWQPDKNHSFKWSLTRFDLANLTPLFDLPSAFVGEISGEGVVSGVIDELFGYATLEASARYGDMPPLQMSVSGDFQSTWQRVKVNLTSQQGQTGLLDIRYDGNLGNIVRGEQRAEEAPIKLLFDMDDFDLEQLNPFMPAGLYDIAGRLSVDMSLKGTLADPTIKGIVTLKETEVAVSGIYNPFTNINATLEFSDKDILVNEFQFVSGEGTATADASGTISAWNKFKVSASFESKKLGVGLSGLPPIKMDTDIAVNLDRNEDVLHVDVGIGKTVVELEDWVKTAVKPAPENENVILVEQKEKPRKQTEADGISIELKVANSAPLRLNGSLLDTTWDVDIAVATGKGPARIDGKATIVTGSFEILGNSFNVEEADLIFDQAAEGEPFLNMIAVTDFPDTQVKATIRGRVSHPELTLTSIPSMNEADIYSLLLVGTTDMDAGGSQSANLLMGVASMKAPIMKQAMRKAGISQFSVGEAREGEGQVMTIGTRLRSDLVMQVTVNLNAKEGENESELRFVYDISREWKFETGIGPAYSSIDVFWHVPLKPEKSTGKAEHAKSSDEN